MPSCRHPFDDEPFDDEPFDDEPFDDEMILNKNKDEPTIQLHRHRFESNIAAWTSYASRLLHCERKLKLDATFLNFPDSVFNKR